MSKIDKKIYLTWQSPSFIPLNRSKTWYVVVFSILIFLVALGLYLNIPSFSVVLIIFAMVYSFVYKTEPKIYDVVLSDVDIQYGNKTYLYTDMEYFWIENNPPYFQSIRLMPKKSLQEEIVIYFYDINPTTLRSILELFLPENTTKQITFTEQITRILGL